MNKELVYTIKYIVSAEFVQMQEIMDKLSENGEVEIIDVQVQETKEPK